MAEHNLGAVAGFEFMRIITRKWFWAGTLAVPLIMAVVLGLMGVSNTTTPTAPEAQLSAGFSIAYTDQSGLITAAEAATFGASKATSREHGIRAVQSGSVDAFFEFPADPAKSTVNVHAADRGIFENNKYSAAAQAMLSQAVTAKIGSAELLDLTGNAAAIDVKTYRGTVESGGINAAIPPLLFLMIFYMLIFLLAGQMLNSALEEKENRVTEMILTTVKPATLISGKVLALFAIGLLQMVIFATPIIIGYVFFREKINIPAFDFSALIFEPVPMITGLLILIGGFALFTTTLVAIGAAVPTAKEAGNLMGVIIVLVFVPLYAASLIISDPQDMMVQIFTYFPFSAPVTALLRNGLGSLSTGEAAIVITILYIGATLMFRLAVRLFQHGSIAYTSRVNIRTALGQPAKSAPAPAK
jgi:ABC-2 type transport system permease protein